MRFGLLFIFAHSIFAQTTTAYGLTFPNSHPRLFWTPARLATAQAWVTNTGYAGLSSGARTLDDYDLAFTCYVMNNATACANAIADATALSITCSSGAGCDDMRTKGEWAWLIYDWMAPGCGKTQCLTSGQASTMASNWTTWQANQDNPTQTWGNVRMPTSNYFAGQFRNDFNFGIASYNETAAADANLQYGMVSRWTGSLLNFISLSGTGINGTHGYALHNQEGGGEYGRYSLNYYAQALATSVLLGRDLWTETTGFQSGVLQTIYNTTPAQTTSRSMYDLFTWGDDEVWVAGANCGLISHNGPDGHGGCGPTSQYYGDFMQAAVTEYSSIAIGKLGRQWISTVNPAIGPMYKSVDPGGSTQAFSTLPLDYYASGPQYMYARSDWTVDATSLLWQLGIYRGDNLNATVGWGSGHSHWDAGTFQVNRKGTWLIRETMTYSETVAGYNDAGTVDGVLGFAHNVPLVGGQAQINVYGANADGPGVVLRLETQPNYSYAATDLTLTYQNNVADPSHPSRENSHVVSIIRELIYFRGINALVVFDRFQNDSSSTSTTFVSHCEVAPTLSSPTATCIENGQEAKYTALIPATPSMVAVNEHDNSATCAISPNSECQYRIESNNSNPGNVVNYQLNVIQFCDSGSCGLTPGVVDSSSGTPSSGTFTVTLDGSNQIVFNKGITSSGGTITAASVSGSLATSVESMTITSAGPVWGFAGGSSISGNVSVNGSVVLH